MQFATLVDELESGRAPRPLVWTLERVAEWERTGRRPAPVMVWTPQQTGTFLDRAHADRLYALWHPIAYRGLRRGEAVNLRWSELDLDRGSATIREQLADEGSRSPKSDAGNRTVSLGAQTVAVLRAQRAAQNRDRLAWGEAWVGWDTSSRRRTVSSSSPTLSPSASIGS
jgi:integrase